MQVKYINVLVIFFYPLLLMPDIPLQCPSLNSLSAKSGQDCKYFERCPTARKGSGDLMPCLMTCQLAGRPTLAECIINVPLLLQCKTYKCSYSSRLPPTITKHQECCRGNSLFVCHFQNGYWDRSFPCHIRWLSITVSIQIFPLYNRGM